MDVELSCGVRANEVDVVFLEDFTRALNVNKKKEKRVKKGKKKKKLNMNQGAGKVVGREIERLDGKDC